MTRDLLAHIVPQSLTGRFGATLSIEKRSILCVRYLSKMHFVLRQPRNLHLKLHKVLCLPRHLHVLRLPRNLRVEVHQALRLPRNLHMMLTGARANWMMSGV